MSPTDSTAGAVHASAATGAPISLGRSDDPATQQRVLDLLAEEGADLARVAVGHCDALSPRPDELEPLLDRGVFVQFDQLGRLPSVLSVSDDQDVATAVLELARRGHAERILLSQDVSTKSQLLGYGGGGYGFILRQFVPYLKMLGADELTGVIVRDIAVGADDTGIRSGIIGEVGAESVPLTGNELKSVRASGRASRATGAPVTFHFGGVGEEKFRVLDILEEEGVAPSNIVMGHGMDVLMDPSFAERLLARGVFVEFDFMASPGSPWGHLVLTSDHKVIRGIADLVERGYAPQIVLGHDVCQKIQLKRYGGKGYDYIPRHFLPALRRLGVSAEVIHMIMVENPARALTFAEPR
ncbi:hypothetical protein AB0J28_14280 [Streptosporangium canum]|uniref:phosphotriesterase family protein n=1 Tax=Streptosporangium canum TaxID=324952 RepID=UPI00342CC906